VPSVARRNSRLGMEGAMEAKLPLLRHGWLVMEIQVRDYSHAAGA
jgi:hypothetical protein